MRVPGYQNLMRNTGNPTQDRLQAIQADWLRDPRNLAAVLMAAAIINKQQDAGAGDRPGNLASDRPGNTEAAQ